MTVKHDAEERALGDRELGFSANLKPRLGEVDYVYSERRRTINDDILAHSFGCGTRSRRVNYRDYNMACEKATSLRKEAGTASACSRI